MNTRIGDIVKTFLLKSALIISLMIISNTFAVPISGRVIDSQSREIIPGAHIKLIDGTAGAVTNLQGEFTLEIGGEGLPVRILVTHISFESDTFIITSPTGNQILLRAGAIMGGEVVVEEVASGSGRNIDGDFVGNVDIIERRDAGAMVLGDLLQGLIGANIQVCCALDSRAELRLLGLPGGYTEITLDGIPEIGGLAGNYRLYSYPAIGISRMEVKKGASSAYSQAKAIGGHLDIQTREPGGEIPEGSIAAYYRSVGGNQLQGELATKIGGIGVASAFDMASSSAFDRDGDGWSESPKNERSFGRVRMSLGDNHAYGGNITGLFIRENRLGGMMGFDREVFGDGEHWIRSVITQRYEGSFDFSMPLADGRFSLSGTAADVDLDQIVGEGRTIVNESGYALRGKWNRDILATKFSMGAEYRAETIEDTSPANEGRLDSEDDRISLIAEDEFYPAFPLAMKAGLRLDSDSRGTNNREWNLFPRLSLKWDISSELIMLASYGSGGRFRPSVQDLMEGYDQSISVVVPTDLQNERGYAATIGSEWRKLFGTDILTIAGGGSFSSISRRIVPISDTEGTLTYINADGPTSVSSLHLQGSMDWARGITLQAGSEFTKSQTELRGVTSTLPFTPEWRGFAKFVWKDFVGIDGLKIWTNSTLFGPQDLPENSFGISRSKSFSIHDIATTFRTGPISFTFGVWNIFDEIQSISPLQGTADPFASGVSTELVYGPLVGRNYMASVVYHFGLSGNVLMGAGYGGLVEKSGDSHAKGENDDHDGHDHTADSPRERPAPTINDGHIHGESCDHGHSETSPVPLNTLIEANVWLIDEEGRHFTCPATGNSGIVDDKTPFTLLGNKKYYHCCPSCKGEDKLKASLRSGFVVPGNIIEEDQDGLRYLCPVMGKEGIVTANTTHSDYNGKRYYFCCPPCKTDFEKSPSSFAN